MTRPHPQSSPRLHLGALAVLLAMCTLVACVSGAVTAESVGVWYTGLVMPSFNPAGADDDLGGATTTGRGHT
jgi:hypothetical protein